MLTPKRYDGCLTTPDSDRGSFGISQHDYSYSMGIGDAWSVKVRYVTEKGKRGWRGGSLYNYGLEPPHYPVPAIRPQPYADNWMMYAYAWSLTD